MLGIIVSFLGYRLERRNGRVVRTFRLSCKTLPEGREFKPGLGNPMTGRLSLSLSLSLCQHRVNVSNQGKDGVCCARSTVNPFLLINFYLYLLIGSELYLLTLHKSQVDKGIFEM